MPCEKTITFQDTVTRIDAWWANSVEAIRQLLACATTKEQAQAALDIVPRSEFQITVNNLQAQISANESRIAALEACLDGYCIRVVASMPADPDPTIIYHVTGV